MSFLSYHPGELAAQDKAGTRGAAAELAAGKRSALSFSSSHDAFLAAQSFAALASVDIKSQSVWVTPLFGKAGDLTATSEHEILISASCIPNSEILKFIEPGTPLSLLGIDLNRRIRHRISGTSLTSMNQEHESYSQMERYTSPYWFVNALSYATLYPLASFRILSLIPVVYFLQKHDNHLRKLP